MPTVFPAGLDNFTNPAAADALSTPTVLHHEQHANLNDAVEAVEAWALSSQLLAASAGTEQASSGTLVFSNLNGITFGLHNNTLTASVAGAGAITAINLSAGTTKNNLSAVTFSNSNGVSFGISESVVTATVATNYQSQGAYLTTAMLSNAVTLSNIKVSAGTLSALRSALTFADSNGVSFGLETNGSLTATVATNYQSQGAYLTTAALSADTSKYVENWKLTGNTAGTTSSAQGTDLWLAGGNGVTISGSSNTLSFSVATAYQSQGAYLTTADLSANSSKYVQNWKLTGNTAGTTSSAQGTDLWLAGGNGVTISGSSNSLSFSVATAYQSQGAYLTTADLSANSSTYFQKWSLLGNTAGTTTTQSLSILQLSGGQGITLSGNSNTIVFSVGSYITTADLSANSSTYFQKWSLLGNTAGTSTTQSLSILQLSGGQGITLSGNSNTIVFSVGSYITTARGSTDAIGLNTANTNVIWTVNSSGISFNAAGYAGTATAVTNCSATVNSGGVSINVPRDTISSFENMDGFGGATATMTFNGASVSHGVAFLLPLPGSFSFLRIPVLMTTNSTTVASAAALSTGGGFVYSTWNAVAYSMNTGGSSQSLASFAKGAMSATLSNSFSFNPVNSAWSISQGFTFNVGGNQTSVSTQYSMTSASANFSTTYLTNNSSLRWLDINFANSLSAGAYWLLMGYSSSSTTSGQSGGPLTNVGVSYSNHYGRGQLNSWFEQMNATAGSSGGYLGAGSFSTNAANTTASLGLSNISSSISNNRFYFQLLRSA